MKEAANIHLEPGVTIKSTDLELGLLINFGHYPKVEIERIVR